MKKKILALFTIVVIMISFCSCTEKNISENVSQEFSVEKLLAESENKSVFENNTKSYSAQQLIPDLEFHFPRFFSQEQGQPPLSIADFNKEYPITILRNGGKGVYAIYHISEGGYIYAFFDMVESSNNGENVVDYYYSGYLYASKILGDNDLKSIVIGNDISTVYLLDPATKKFAEICKDFYTENEIRTVDAVFVSLLAEDGIYYVKYDYYSGKITAFDKQDNNFFNMLAENDKP